MTLSYHLYVRPMEFGILHSLQLNYVQLYFWDPRENPPLSNLSKKDVLMQQMFCLNSPQMSHYLLTKKATFTCIDKIGNVYNDTETLCSNNKRTGCKVRFLEIHSLLGKMLIGNNVRRFLCCLSLSSSL